MLKRKYSKDNRKLVESFEGEQFIVPEADIYRGVKLDGTYLIGDDRLPNIIDEIKAKFFSKNISDYKYIALEILGDYDIVLVHESFLREEYLDGCKYIYNLDNSNLSLINFNEDDFMYFYEYTWYPENYPVYFDTIFGIKNIYDVIEMDHYIIDKEVHESDCLTEKGYSTKPYSSITNNYHLYKKDDELIFCKAHNDNLKDSINSSLFRVENLNDNELEEHCFYSNLKNLYCKGEIKELTREEATIDIPF